MSSLQAIEQALGFQLEKEAPNRDQLRRSQYLNHYLLNEEGQVIGLHLGTETKGTLKLGADFQHLALLKIKSSELEEIEFEVDMSNLDLLDLSNCGLKSFTLPDGFQSLKIAILHHNQIEEFYLEGNELSSLEIVDLSYNPIPEIHLSSKLPQLGYFYAYGSNLEIFTVEQDLPNLQVLELRKSQLKEIHLEACKRIERLDLSDLEISHISPDWIHKFPLLETFVVKGNPIQNIPRELFDKDEHVWEDVKNYFSAIETKGEVINNEVKIILIGNGSVGKTQIARRLAYGKEFNFNETHDSTHSISLLRREIKALIFNIWDFGGQDMYHATHRLFMQTRALFLLVWDIDNEAADEHFYKGEAYKNEKLPYWLSYATCFGDQSPVIVVQNKVDGKQEESSILTEIEQDRYREKFPVIKKFLATSAKTGKGFKILEHRLPRIFKEDESLKNDLLITVPKPWSSLREKVREEQSKKDGLKEINLETFEAWCEKVELIEQSQTILRFLHNTGVLYYKEGYFANRIILDQGWAIEAVYKVLDKDSEYFEILRDDKKGLLEYEELEEIWDEYSDDERELFIEFMVDCELCFEIEAKGQNKHHARKPLNERKFRLPQLLSETKPDALKSSNYLKDYGMDSHTEVYFHFLPAVYMHQFIARAKDFASGQDMWRKGIVIQVEGQRAMVEAVYDSQPQKIMIFHPTNDLGLLQVIQEELQKIANEGNIIVPQTQAGKKDSSAIWLEETRKAMGDKGGFERLRNQTHKEVFLSKINIVKSGNIMQGIPEFFIEDLKNQVTEQYEKIIRYRDLRNDERDSDLRKKYADEINLRQENIKEIQSEFLNQVQNDVPSLSQDDAKSLTSEIVSQVLTALNGEIDLENTQSKINALSPEIPDSLRENLKGYIRENQLEKALNVLDDHFKKTRQNEAQNQIILLLRYYSQNEESHTIGTINQADYGVMKTKIAQSVLKILEL